MKVLTFSKVAITSAVVSVILFYAVVGIACLHMTTPIVTQEPTREDIERYIKTRNPQFTADESEMR